MTKLARVATQKKMLALLITLGFGGAFLALLPLFSGPYYIHIFILVFLNATLASGYRLLYVTGLGSFCHITLFGMGAYAAALLATRLGVPFGFCFLAAGLVPAIAAALLAWPAVRAKGPYFFIISFGFWVVMDAVFRRWGSLTGGIRGVPNIPPIMGIKSVEFYYYISLVFAAVVILILYRIAKSRFGKELEAIGDSDDLAESIGINVVRYRILAFAIGALFAGFAGSIYASHIRYISPFSFGLWPTVYILIWCVVGGERRAWGPVVGAVALTLISELLRMSGSVQAILYSIVLLVVIMTMPHGLVGLVDTLRTKLKRYRTNNRDKKLEIGPT